MHNLIAWFQGSRNVAIVFGIDIIIGCHYLSLGFQINKFEEHNIGYQPSKFQCFRLSLSNLTEWSGKHPSPVLQQDKNPSAYRVKTSQ